MRPVYAGRELTEQEVADLAAFFGGTDAQEPAAGTDWLLTGVIGALTLFGLMAVFCSSAPARFLLKDAEGHEMRKWSARPTPLRNDSGKSSIATASNTTRESRCQLHRRL